MSGSIQWRLRPLFPLCLCALPLLLLLGGDGGRAAWAGEEPTTTASGLALWSDQAHLDKELTFALRAVEREQGRPFKVRPTVQVTSTKEMARILESELGDTLRRLGTADELVTRSLRMLAMGLVMKYEPAKDIVHVVPENVERIVTQLKRPELASPGVLRITLIHEAVHGHDFQHYPHLDVMRRERESSEGIQAVGAILEGHAQFVASRAARRLGLEPAFGQLVELTTAVPEVDNPVAKVLIDVMIAEVRFAYEGGQRFFEAVYAARGDAGVDRALRDPPTHVRQIEQPEVYLDPSKAGPSIDPKVVLAPFQAWSEAAKRTSRKFPFKRSQLDAVYTLLPAAQTEVMRNDFKQGWGAVSQKVSQADMVAVILLEFGSEAGAEGYLKHFLALLKKKDELMREGPIRITKAIYEEGVGVEGRLPGVVCTKTAVAHGNELVVVAHGLRIGRFAMELTCMDDSLGREVQNALVGKLAEALGRAAGGATAEPDSSSLLRDLVASFRKAQTTQDETALESLGASICPSSAELGSVCRPGADSFLAAYKGPKDITLTTPPGAALSAGKALFRPADPAQTEIAVHAATTEELVAYAEGTLAFREFPGGMRRFAEQVAAPGRTWYVVELLEPGRAVGMKYTCFTQVGERFVVLLKPWRAMAAAERK